MKITATHDYFWHQREIHPERKEISLDHCQYVLDHRNEGLHYEQSDGKFRYTAPVPELGYWVRVIMLGDRETLFNAFADTEETHKFEQRHRARR